MKERILKQFKSLYNLTLQNLSKTSLGLPKLKLIFQLKPINDDLPMQFFHRRRRRIPTSKTRYSFSKTKRFTEILSYTIHNTSDPTCNFIAHCSYGF